MSKHDLMADTMKVSGDELPERRQHMDQRMERTDFPLLERILFPVPPIDDQAIKHWKAYSLARNEMLARTHNPMAPWTLVGANDKRLARLNIIKNLLGRLHYTARMSG